ncbi:hypothetical protein CPB86DRAFT_631684 [Serendipita vermifera]|nr:hypothetical protein CPB86DRAFT_631684 [Serendipita vermifera]
MSSSYDFFQPRLLSPTPSENRHTYRGHRKISFVASDTAELVELRARQRTFDGGYMRATTLTLCNGILCIKLFDKRFYSIGILFICLAVLLSIITYFRRRQCNRDFSDQLRPLPTHVEKKRIFGGPFITAGWVVLAITTVIVGAQILLVILILSI